MHVVTIDPRKGKKVTLSVSHELCDSWQAKNDGRRQEKFRSEK